MKDYVVAETGYVGKRVGPFHPANVLLLTSDWHTARAGSVFRRRLAQYHWSVAAAKDPRLFGTHWWRRREWAKITFNEWLKVVWWNAVDRLAVITAKNRKTISKQIPKTLLDTPNPEQYDSRYWKVVLGMKRRVSVSSIRTFR